MCCFQRCSENDPNELPFLAYDRVGVCNCSSVYAQGLPAHAARLWIIRDTSLGMDFIQNPLCLYRQTEIGKVLLPRGSLRREGWSRGGTICSIIGPGMRCYPLCGRCKTECLSRQHPRAKEHWSCHGSDDCHALLPCRSMLVLPNAFCFVSGVARSGTSPLVSDGPKEYRCIDG